MAKKKQEHMVFDNMPKPKKGIPFGGAGGSAHVNNKCGGMKQTGRPVQKTFNRKTP